MRTPTDSYWEKRSRQRMASYQRDAEKTILTITRAYDKAMRDINDEIERIFRTFGKNGQMDPEKARKVLNQRIPNPLLELAKQIYPRLKNERVRRWLLSKMNAPAYRARITRLQALKEQVYLRSKEIADAEITASTYGYVNTVREAYYRTMFDLQHGIGVGFEFAAMPQSTVETILKNPWSGKHFSNRIWANTEALADMLSETITAGFMSGKGNAKIVKEIEERAEVGKHAAARLVRTETTYMANAAEMESYQEADIDQYIFVATLDSRTSQTCRQHDHKVYDVKDAVPGQNMPPLHPYCRSTTRAYFGEDTLQNIQRRARDPVTGEAQLVPASLSYEDWRKQYVVDKHGQSKVEQVERQQRNVWSDRQQYDRYKELLGSDAPKSFSRFQALKYTEAEKWAALKRQYSTFNEIQNSSFTDEYKRKLIDTYRYFRKDGYEFKPHALNRVLGPKRSKGKTVYTKEDIEVMLAKPPNYVQPDGKTVRFENGVAILQAPDTGEIIGIVARNTPKSDWKEV